MTLKTRSSGMMFDISSSQYDRKLEETSCDKEKKDWNNSCSQTCDKLAKATS